MAAIRTSSLTKRFGDVVAVDDLDLSVAAGEVFGFLGPNGAGKSTTINALLDFVRPTEGSATVLGYDAQAESDELRHRIGVLPEGASVYDRLTGREHLEWVVDTKGTDDDVDALLDRVGLDSEDADRPAGGYSKGMQQRLGFGMALVGDPDLLILDEPSFGLNPTGMQELRAIIAAEADRGTTVFFSSHILGGVNKVCDRIGIMNEGRLVATGTLPELRRELNLSTLITVEVSSVPAELDLAALEGVRSVEVDGNYVTVRCGDPSGKIDVVGQLAVKTDVLDIVSEDASLEKLFNSYTTESEDDAPRSEVVA